MNKIKIGEIRIDKDFLDRLLPLMPKIISKALLENCLFDIEVSDTKKADDLFNEYKEQYIYLMEHSKQFINLLIKLDLITNMKMVCFREYFNDNDWTEYSYTIYINKFSKFEIDDYWKKVLYVIRNWDIKNGKYPIINIVNNMICEKKVIWGEVQTMGR